MTAFPPHFLLAENYVKLLEVGDYGLDDNEDGYKKKIKNDDGSITYVFTRKQYNAIMSQLNEAMEESISNTDAFEHIVKIKANEDYTYFTFVSDNEKLSLADAFIPTPFPRQLQRLPPQRLRLKLQLPLL